MKKLTPEQRASGRILLTADQVVTHKGAILEKPITADEARKMIRGYGLDPSVPCCTVGSCVLTDTKSGERVAGVDVAEIYFDQNVSFDTAVELGIAAQASEPDSAKVPVDRQCSFNDVSSLVANKLVDSGEVFYCAGSLMVEHSLVNPFVRIVGTIESVMGLSPKLLLTLWEQMTKNSTV